MFFIVNALFLCCPLYGTVKYYIPLLCYSVFLV
nr:MAG TPA: hypothetical protein [Caudoviricetes sp.]